MSSIDFLIESEYFDDQLQRTVAAVLQVSISNILVIYDLSEYPQTQAGQVVCMVQRLPEGFRQFLTIDYATDFDVDDLFSE